MTHEELLRLAREYDTSVVDALSRLLQERNDLRAKLEEAEQEREAVKLRAYRQARICEPNMDMYHGAMSVYSAAFGLPHGEPTVVLPSGETKQGWQLDPRAEASRGEVVTACPQWQPIETAPKDGTPILVCEEHGWRCIAVYSDGAFVPWVPGGFEMRCEPTHWMPLPAVPVKTS